MERLFKVGLDFMLNTALILVTAITLLVVVTSFIGLYFARLDLDSAKRIIVSEVEKSNQVNLEELEKTLSKEFKPKKLFFAQSGPIQFAYGDNQNKGGNLKKSDSGYYGRALELVIYRDIKLGWLKKPIRFSTGVSISNRGVMQPTKDIEYRVGEEYM